MAGDVGDVAVDRMLDAASARASCRGTISTRSRMTTCACTGVRYTEAIVKNNARNRTTRIPTAGHESTSIGVFPYKAGRLVEENIENGGSKVKGKIKKTSKKTSDCSKETWMHLISMLEQYIFVAFLHSLFRTAV
jgi:hypothetical protein